MSNQFSHEIFMARCLELAKMGKGHVAPNPMVGSLIVHQNKIIGEGYHQVYGSEHAEVNAINSVIDQHLLKEATIYVNLEPCAHYGKTPPCANLIVEKGIKRAVIGCTDPFDKVAGKGIEKLKNAGIEVITNVLEKESLHLNRRFFKFHDQKRPYIILKWAQSINGKIDIDRTDGKKGVFWITQPETKSLVHQWRAEEAGILVGRKTVEIDDPDLTCRVVKGKNPVRIIIDKQAKLTAENHKIGNNSAPTIIVNKERTEKKKNVTWLKVADFSLDSILNALYQEDIQSIIVEGGAKTLQSFIDHGLWDEARIISGVNSISQGTPAPVLCQLPVHQFKFGMDQVNIIRR